MQDLRLIVQKEEKQKSQDVFTLKYTTIKTYLWKNTKNLISIILE